MKEYRLAQTEKESLTDFSQMRKSYSTDNVLKSIIRLTIAALATGAIFTITGITYLENSITAKIYVLAIFTMLGFIYIFMHTLKNIRNLIKRKTLIKGRSGAGKGFDKKSH